MITIICEWCSTPFQVRQYRASTARCCSRSCLNKATASQREPQRLSAIRGRTAHNNAQVSISCERCGKEFLVPPSRVNKRKYCSSSCAASASNARNAPDRVAVTCARCGKEFSVLPSSVGKRKYCSAPCAKPPHVTCSMIECKVCGISFSLKYKRAGQKQIYCSKTCSYADHYVEKTCLTCGKNFTINTLNAHREYCSLSCIERSPCQLCGKIITGRATFQSGERRFCSRRCASIVNSSMNPKKKYTTLGFAATIKRIGKLACECCGEDDVHTLIVHHVDRNHANLTEDNLVTLCANCHFREHWKGSVTRQRTVQVAHYVARYRTQG